MKYKFNHRFKAHSFVKSKAENQCTDCDSLVDKITWLVDTRLHLMTCEEKRKLLSCATMIERYQQNMPIKKHDKWYGILCRMMRKYETYQR